MIQKSCPRKVILAAVWSWGAIILGRRNEDLNWGNGYGKGLDARGVTEAEVMSHDGGRFQSSPSKPAILRVQLKRFLVAGLGPVLFIVFINKLHRSRQHAFQISK